MSFEIRDGQSIVQGDFSALEKLIANLEEDHSVDVGVFESAVTGDGMSVAEYGAYNEFGSITTPDHPPKRSFIRMPLQTKSATITTFVEKHSAEHLKAGNVKAIFEDIGIGAEAVIQQAFDTRGFGTWRPDAESTIDKKGHDSVLIGGGKSHGSRDVGGLLRHSITHRTK